LKRLLIIKTGRTLPELSIRKGDFEDWILRGMQWPIAQAEVVDVKQDSLPPSVMDFSGIVITGSHDMVTDQSPWMLGVLQWLREAVVGNKPLLGICFGHQLLAAALGGTVADNPRGPEFGLVEIHKTELGEKDPLLKNLPQRFRALVSHVQSVIRLPQKTIPLAHSEKDLYQAIRLDKNAWGVQFHPEMDCEIMRAYIQRNREKIEQNGISADELIRNCHGWHHGTQVLEAFREIVLNGS